MRQHAFSSWLSLNTPERVVARIDRLLECHTDAETAALLNDGGLRTGRGAAFRSQRVQAIRREYGLSSRYERLRARGLLSITEVAAMLGVSTDTVKKRRRRGLLKGHLYNDRNQRLYELPGDVPPVGKQGRKPTGRRPARDHAAERANEVQYEA